MILTWSRPADHLKPGLLEIEGRIPPVEPLVVRLSPEECAYLGTREEDGEENEKKRIEQALGTKRMQADEIVAKTGIPYSTTKKRLDSMKGEGRVGSVSGPGKGSPHLWFRLTAENVMDRPVSKSLPVTTKMED